MADSIGFVIIICLLFVSALMFKSETDNKRLIWSVIAGGLLLRVILVLKFPEGFEADVRLFFHWAEGLNKHGIWQFYQNVNCDYPPGYLYILAVLGQIIKALHLAVDDIATNFIMRAPAIICDLAAIWILGKYAIRQKADFLRVCVIYAVCPPVLINSCAWGQIDSVWLLPLLGSLIYLHRKKAIACAVCFAVSLLIKPQSLIFAPIFLFGFADKNWWKNYLKTAAAGLLTFLAGLFPFVGFNFDVFWNKYFGTINLYPYASVNGYNFYAMIGSNWTDLNNRFLFVNYKFWGYAVIIGAVLFTAYLYFKKYKNVYYASYILMTALFLFATMQHERYLYPVFALMLITYIYTGNERLLYCMSALAIANFLNVYLVLMLFNDVPSEAVFLVSALTVAGGIYALAIPQRNASYDA